MTQTWFLRGLLFRSYAGQEPALHQTTWLAIAVLSRRVVYRGAIVHDLADDHDGR